MASFLNSTLLTEEPCRKFKQVITCLGGRFGRNYLTAFMKFLSKTRAIRKLSNIMGMINPKNQPN